MCFCVIKCNTIQYNVIQSIMNSWIQLHDCHLSFQTILHMNKKSRKYPTDIILLFQAEAHKKHQNTLEVWSQQPSFATLFWQRLFRWDFDSSSSSSSLWASPSGIFPRRPAAVPSALPMTIKGSSITLLPMAVLQALLFISLVVVNWRICEVQSEFEVLRKKNGNIGESPIISHGFQIICMAWFSVAFFCESAMVLHDSVQIRDIQNHCNNLPYLSTFVNVHF